MRPKIVAGNWKMNKNVDEAMELAVNLNLYRNEFSPEVTVIIAPPALYLPILGSIENTCFSLSAQNCSHHDYGAFTGEISPSMLNFMNIGYCIVGHSERRQYFHETDEIISKKIEGCLRNHIVPIFCCGESLNERNAHTHFVTVLHQIEHALFHLKPHEMEQVIIAYEPVWAIGTGVTATTEQAEEMHAFIRQTVKNHFGDEIATHIRILYGGSVNAANSKELFACPNVDGGLVGGASLKAKDFATIITSAS